MPITLEQVRRFLGRTLQDPYGRAFGKVVGISANLRDEVTGVGIEEGNGEFLQCPGDRVTITGDSLILAPAWKVEAEEFRKEFDIVTRRLRALDELFSVGDIQKDDATQGPPAAQQPQPIPQVPQPTTTTTSPPRDPVLVLHVRET